METSSAQVSLAPLAQAKAGFADAGRIRLFDFLCGFALLAIPGLVSVGIPVVPVLMVAIILMAQVRRPAHSMGRLNDVIPLIIAALVYIAIISATANQSADAADWRLRLVRIAAIFGFAAVLATNRFDLRSVIYGYGAGLLVNVPFSLAGLGNQGYGDYITGLLSDKNVSGLAYCIIGIFFLYYMPTMPLRILSAAVFAGCLWLTGSRTSMGAFAAAFIWVLLAPRMMVVVRWLYAYAVFLLISILEEDYAQSGSFADRKGSDLLRARIDAASEIKVHDAGFWGKGLGEAFVYLDQNTWFFHNSFWTALVEGGWPWLAFTLFITVIVAGRPFTAKLTQQQFAAQAMIVAILVCASRLGEVFYTPYWAFAMAFALQAHMRAHESEIAAVGSERALAHQKLVAEGKRVGPRRSRRSANR